jgi:hypothetical protein
LNYSQKLPQVDFSFAVLNGYRDSIPSSDGRRIRVTIDGSNVLAMAQIQTSDGSDGYNIIGLNPYSRPSVHTTGVTGVSDLIVLSLQYFLEQLK